MLQPDLFLVFTERLEEARIPYMVTGSVAAIAYGEPRLTHDVDVVVELKLLDVPRLRTAFPDGEFYCPPSEALVLETRRRVRGHFNLIHYASGFKADLYLVGDDALHRWAMSRRVHLERGGSGLWLAPPEYVILRKLEYFREGGSEKHLRDVAAILELSPERIDFVFLNAKVVELGLEESWAAARDLSEA